MDFTQFTQTLGNIQNQLNSLSQLAGTFQKLAPPADLVKSPDMAALIKQAVDAEMAKRTNPTATPATPATTIPVASPEEVSDFLGKLKLAIGGSLDLNQQIWLSSNLVKLPDFFKSADGKSTINSVLDQFKKYTER